MCAAKLICMDASVRFYIVVLGDANLVCIVLIYRSIQGCFGAMKVMFWPALKVVLVLNQELRRAV